MKKKVGLMLGGGGAKGAYQLGVIKALEEKGLADCINVVSGTSVGAINTLLFMIKKDYSFMRNMWKYFRSSYVFSSSRSDKKGIFDVRPLLEEVSSQIPLAAIQNARVKGFATTSKVPSKRLLAQLNLLKMEKVVFNLNTVKEPFKAVSASSSIPLVFGTTEIDGSSYVDGGMLDNHPVEPLLLENCNIVLSVPLDTRFNPLFYENFDILHVDFSSKSVFQKMIIAEAADVIKFDEDYENFLIELGFRVGKLLIKKCVYNGYIVINGIGKYKWVKPMGYHYIGISDDDEKKISAIKNRLESKQKIDEVERTDLKYILKSIIKNKNHNIIDEEE